MRAFHGAALLLPVFVLCISDTRADGGGPPLSPELFVSGPLDEDRNVVREQAGENHFLDRSDFEQLPGSSLDTLLKEVPGFTLFRRGDSTVTNPTAQGVSLRGTGPSGASRTLVLRDGLPVNDSFGGWVDWQSLSPLSLETARAQENWGSVHWSYLGLGSAIELETRMPSAPTGELQVFGGTEQTGSADLFVGGSRNAFHYSLDGNYFRTDGYTVISPEDRGPIDQDAGSEHKSGTVRVGYDLTSDTSVYFESGGFEEARANGTVLTANGTAQERVSSGFDVRRPDDTRIHGDIFAGYTHYRSTFSSQSADRTGETPASDQHDVPSSSTGVSVDWSKRFAGGDYLEVGSDALWRDGRSDEFYNFQAGDYQRARSAGAEQEALGAYGLYKAKIGRLDATGFLRLDGWQTSGVFREEGAIDSGTLDRDDHSSRPFLSFWEPRAQLSYDFDGHSEVRSALTRGIRIPTINELVRPFRLRNDVTEANPQLAAEESLGYDLEYKYHAAAWEGSVTGFINRIRNQIFNGTITTDGGNSDSAAAVCPALPASGTCRQRQNLDSVLIGGMELNLRYDIDERFALSGSYLLSASDVKNPGEFDDLRGKRVAEIPLHQGAVRLEGRSDVLRGFLQLRVVGSQFDDDLNTITLGSYATFDAALTIPVSTAASLFITAENLFDVRYDVQITSDGVSSIGPPLAILAGLRLRL